MKNKVAFVYYPHGPKSARLETMPFALNSIVALAASGWDVDLYLWERPIWGSAIADYSQLLPSNVHLRYFTELRYSPVNSWIDTWLRLRFGQQNQYLAVFGLGQKGAFIGSVMAKAGRCPFIQIVDEFPSNWPESLWSELERQAAKQATMLIIPDAQQFPFLAKELNIPLTTPYAVLPNVASVDSQLEPINWHERLELPKNSIPFLYAGTVSAWAQIPELLSTVPDWPESTVLIVHSRSEREIQSFRQQYPHLEIPDRIIWSSEPLPQDALNSLVAYCEGNFALYQNTGPHIEYIGFSSGKLMRSLMCGTPVIASNLISLNFVRKHDLGVLVDDVSQTPQAVKQLVNRREEYRSRCLNFCKVYASFEDRWSKFCYAFSRLTNIDLHNPNSLSS